LDKHPAQYTYRAESGTLANLRDLIANRTNLRVFSGSKTFEYDLALANLGMSCITTDAMESAAEMRTFCLAPDALPPELEGLLVSETLSDIEAITDANEKKRHRFAAVYLACAEGTKGAHAFALERALGALASPLPPETFLIPPYVQAGIEWVVPDA
jgi:hypothetical protein